MKRLLYTVFAVVMCTLLAASVVAADVPESAKVVYTLSDATANPGDTIEIVLSVEASQAYNSVAVAGFEFDEEAFEFVGFSDYEHLDTVLPAEKTIDEDNMNFMVALTSGPEESDLCVLNLKVKDDAPIGTYTLDAGTVITKNGSVAVESFLVPATIVIEAPVYPVEGISLDMETAMLNVGDKVTLTAIITPEKATDKTVTWTSSNTSVVTVNEDGIVTAVAKGEAKITATASNGMTAVCEVTVAVLADKVEFTSLKATSVAVDKTLSLKAKALREDGLKPANANVTFEIISEDEGVATIDAKGKITALAEGEIVVRASALVGTADAYADVVIRVCNVATKVTLNKTKASMALGYGDLQLEAVMTAKTGECNDTLKWSVDKPEIATVDENGLVTALTEGKVKVTATSGSGKSASCTVTIGEPATAVDVTALKTTSIAPEKNVTLKGKAVRDDGVKPVSTTVEFEIIEGKDLATIDAKGKLVAGEEEGTVVVRISAEAGTDEAYEDVEIRICNVATKVTLNKTKAAMALGYGDLQLEAVMTAKTGECTDTLTWSVDKPEIATVDENGLVTALTEGKVKVTALSGSGKKATCTVTIGEPATAVDVTALKTTSIAPEKNVTLKGKAVRDDGVKPVSTTVEFEIIEGKDLATIDAKGKLVAGEAEGEVVVRISAEAGTEDAYEDVTIRICKIATKVTLNMTKATVSLSDGELQLEASMLPEENTDTLSWSVDKPEIATVDECGLVTFHSAGKVKVTAKTGSGKSAACTITVTE